MRSWRSLRLRDRCRVVLASSYTMRKFENFTTTQIFHEINFGISRIPKNGHLDNFWGRDSFILRDFGNFHYLKFSEIKIHSLWNYQNGHFWGFPFAKIDFTKNLSGSKILKFPHCEFRKEGKRGPLGKISFPMFCHIVQLLRWLMIPTLKRIIMSDRKWFLVCVWHSTHHRSFFCSYTYQTTPLLTAYFHCGKTGENVETISRKMLNFFTIVHLECCNILSSVHSQGSMECLKIQDMDWLIISDGLDYSVWFHPH